jgi:hypothetical protein
MLETGKLVCKDILIKGGELLNINCGNVRIYEQDEHTSNIIASQDLVIGGNSAYVTFKQGSTNP